MSLAAPRLIPMAAYLCLAVAGCGEPGGVASHVDPPHWPKDFPDAVAKIVDAQDSAREAMAAGRTEELRDARIPVLRDLAGWLPEVAADSDMPEPPWNRVNDLAGRLLGVYEPMLSDLNAGRAVAPDRLAEADPLLAALQGERDAADPEWFPDLTPRLDDSGEGAEEEADQGPGPDGEADREPPRPEEGEQDPSTPAPPGDRSGIDDTTP